MDAASQQRLRQNLSMADEDALVALANKGLVRRAQKDLEQNAALTIEETDKALLIRGPGWCVTMPPEGPTAARDDSGATGITRFVLAATIYLREHWLISAESADQSRLSLRESASPKPQGASPGSPHAAKPQGPADQGLAADATVTNPTDTQASSPATTSPFDEVIALLVNASIDDLTKWSGKGVFLQATARLKSITEVTVQHTPTLTIDFVSESTRVLLMTDQPERSLKRLLDQFKSTAVKSELVFWVVLAVLVLKRQAGEDLSNVNVLESDITQAVREDRLRLAARCQKLLSSATISGLAHPSSRLIQRFETMAVMSEAARFPRLARLLSSIASDIQLQIERSAAADPQRLIERVLIAGAISKAATRPGNSDKVALYGRSRSHYIPGGSIEMHGLGAYAWRADSGYEGVTAVFWDQAGQHFLTASQARGEGQDQTFSLAMAYETGLGWNGSLSMRNHCRHRQRLDEVKLNWDGRLSSSSSCSVKMIATTNPEQIDFGSALADQWHLVAERARRLQPLGLRVAKSSDAMIVIKPAEWGKRWFDELEQQFVWDLIDDAGQTLQARVPWNELEESSIEFLETIKPDREKLWGLLGRITVFQSRISIYPLSLLSTGGIKGDTILCPHFDMDRLEGRNRWLLERLRSKYGRNRQVHAKIVDLDEEDLSMNLQSIPKAVRDLILTVQQLLHGAIETGAVQMNELAVAQLQAAHELAASLGLRVLERSLRQLLSAQQSQTDQAASILDAAYATQVAAQAAGSLCLHG